MKRKETNCNLKKLKFVLAILFCISIIGGLSITIGGANTDVAYAAESPKTYELKIKLNNKYYWVENDHSISSTCSYLTVGAQFNIANFRNYIGNNEGFVEGKYVQGFKYENTTTECNFASNKVLELGPNALYVIEPNYANEKYQFSFDLNGDKGTTPLATQDYIKGQKANLPTPVRPGYSFDGWKLGEVAFTYNYIPDMSPNVAKETQAFMLKAQWTALVYEITFILDNNQISKKDVTYDAPIGSLPDVIDNGYRFLGFVSTDGKIIITEETDLWQTPKDETLYIRRSTEPTLYEINYNGNGGVISNGTGYYNVTQLPFKLNYTAEREFDYIVGFKLNNTYLSGADRDILPNGTVGNITLDAQWKASRVSASSGWLVSEETFEDEITVVNCTNINKTAIRTINITPSVNEIAFVGKYSDNVISKMIVVQRRSTPLTIHIKNLNWGSPFSSPLIDARECQDLTLHCVNTNRLHGGILFSDSVVENVAVIMCQNLTISGDSLTIIGSAAYTGLDGGIGILAIGDSGELYNAVVISITIDYLYVKGGQGGAGSDSNINGSNGGIGIVCWIAVVIDGHYGQEVYLLGGDGGVAQEGGTDGTRGTDAGLIVQGPYYGSNGYVSGN